MSELKLRPPETRPNASRLALRFLAHFVVRVTRGDEAARALRVGDIWHEGRWVAHARQNLSRSARRQTLLQRQLHGTVNGYVHHAIVLVCPAVAVQSR